MNAGTAGTFVSLVSGMVQVAILLSDFLRLAIRMLPESPGRQHACRIRGLGLNSVGDRRSHELNLPC